ncbi:MAG: hypothetical protein ACYSPI_11550 [Planctomycetota bacterium]|jgi:hypothetical protein
MRQLKNIAMGLLVTLMMAGSVASAHTEAEIDALVAGMTLDEKVGQMTPAAAVRIPLPIPLPDGQTCMTTIKMPP